MKEQHAKLMNAMVAVLNFRQGNEPTSLDAILDKHRGKGITAREFERFHAVFLATMDQFTDGDQRIHQAWDDLLKPMVEYMVAACVDAQASTPKDAAAPAGRVRRSRATPRQDRRAVTGPSAT